MTASDILQALAANASPKLRQWLERRAADVSPKIQKALRKAHGDIERAGRLLDAWTEEQKRNSVPVPPYHQVAEDLVNDYADAVIFDSEDNLRRLGMDPTYYRRLVAHVIRSRKEKAPEGVAIWTDAPKAYDHEYVFRTAEFWDWPLDPDRPVRLVKVIIPADAVHFQANRYMNGNHVALDDAQLEQKKAATEKTAKWRTTLSLERDVEKAAELLGIYRSEGIWKQGYDRYRWKDERPPPEDPIRALEMVRAVEAAYNALPKDVQRSNVRLELDIRDVSERAKPRAAEALKAQKKAERVSAAMERYRKDVDAIADRMEPGEHYVTGPLAEDKEGEIRSAVADYVKSQGLAIRPETFDQHKAHTRKGIWVVHFGESEKAQTERTIKRLVKLSPLPIAPADGPAPWKRVAWAYGPGGEIWFRRLGLGKDGKGEGDRYFRRPAGWRPPPGSKLEAPAMFTDIGRINWSVLDLPGPVVRAAKTVSRFAASDDNRYGLSVLCWDREYLCASDGNRLHGVRVPPYDGVLILPRELDQEIAVDFSVRQTYIVTNAEVQQAPQFPDWRQIVPTRFAVQDTLPLAWIKALVVALKPFDEMRWMPDGTMQGRGVLGESERGPWVPDIFDGRGAPPGAFNHPVGMNARFLREELLTYARAGEACTYGAIRDSLGPWVFRSETQFGVVMPVRLE